MKKLICILLSVWVLMSFCFAFDGDSLDYYSFDSLSPMTASALDYAVMPLAATSWDTSDQSNLAYIRNAFYNPNTGYVSNSIIGWVKKLADNSVDLSSLVSNVSSLTTGTVGTSNSILWYAREIYNDTSELPNIYLSASSSALSLQEINDAIQNDSDSLQDLLKAIWGDTESIDSVLGQLYSISNSFFTRYSTQSWAIALYNYDDNGNLTSHRADMRFVDLLPTVFVNTYHDGVLPIPGFPRTLYSLIKQLQSVLASDADLALSQSQEANREEIEDSFLSGSSGATSLGVSDFGDLADVGGALKDSLSLDGNATIGSFTSGLTAADTAGQGWFSEQTRSQLDAVSSTVTYSLRDPDPYNMSGWEDRYYWLLGDAYD